MIHHYQGQVVQEAKHGYDGKDIPGENIIHKMTIFYVTSHSCRQLMELLRGSSVFNNCDYNYRWVVGI